MRVFAAILAMIMSGCAGAGISTDLAALPTEDQADPVVIALLDSGTTPYYPVFAESDSATLLAAVPTLFTNISIPLDPGEDALTRDEAIWASLSPRELYHFEGTRLLGISFDTPERRFEYVRDAEFHGVATSYLAAREAPDAIIVAVQASAKFCREPSCAISPTLADAMEWIAAQDWIDVVSTSVGFRGNTPDRPEVHAEMARYLAATRAAAASGKLMVSAAGNEPTPPVSDYFNGPPWMVAVGGVDPVTRGEIPRTAKTVDVVANYTDYTAMYGDGDMAWRSGTSFATPIVAGTLANALGKIRTAQPGRVVTTQELRDALNASATYFNATDWDPTPPGREPLPDDITNSASLPVLVQPQMGWGYVEAALADEIARRVLENDYAIPSGKSQAAQFQPRWQQAREDFWDAYG